VGNSARAVQQADAAVLGGQEYRARRKGRAEWGN
jgi:hypothetical protein